MRFRTPSDAAELAAQAAVVATGLLNSTIDLDVARAYGVIAQVAAQALGIQVAAERAVRPRAVDTKLDLERTVEKGGDDDQVG